MTDDKSREAFERWWIRVQGTYNLGEKFAWQGWQAAIRHMTESDASCHAPTKD